MNRNPTNPQSSNSQQQEFKLDGTPYDVDQMIGGLIFWKLIQFLLFTGIGAYGQVRQAIHRVIFKHYYKFTQRF
jgi:hypothetical protein